MNSVHTCVLLMRLMVCTCYNYRYIVSHGNGKNYYYCLGVQVRRFRIYLLMYNIYLFIYTRDHQIYKRIYIIKSTYIYDKNYCVYTFGNFTNYTSSYTARRSRNTHILSPLDYTIIIIINITWV